MELIITANNTNTTTANTAEYHSFFSVVTEFLGYLMKLDTVKICAIYFTPLLSIATVVDSYSLVVNFHP